MKGSAESEGSQKPANTCLRVGMISVSVGLLIGFFGPAVLGQGQGGGVKATGAQPPVVGKNPRGESAPAAAEARAAVAPSQRPGGAGGGGGAAQPEPARRGWGKVLILVTTHMSSGHFNTLKYCWKSAIAASPLLQTADYFVACTLDKTVSLDAVERLAPAVFGGGNRSVRVVNMGNPGFHAGAILPMRQAVEQGWWAGYDWIIRVNPDVVIRNDSWLLDQMRDEGVDGVWVNCPRKRRGRLTIHTDFMVFRPRLLDASSFGPAGMQHAEYMATDTTFREHLRGGKYKLVPGTEHPRDDVCRVQGPNSTVQHDHELHRKCKAGGDPALFVSVWEWKDMLNQTLLPKPKANAQKGSKAKKEKL